MMAGNPSWWSMNNQNSSSTFFPVCPNSLLAQYHEDADHHRSSSSSLLSLNSSFDDDHQEHLPHSWSHLLVNGLANEEDNNDFRIKKLENWEEQMSSNPSLIRGVSNIDINQVTSKSSQLYSGTHGDHISHHEFINDDHINRASNSWSYQQLVNIPVSSPRSSVTSLASNPFEFPSNKRDHSSESNSTSIGGVSKKVRVQSSSTQPSLKVRKEKLGDRITTLHQLVSPFGKTDTASVLLEVIGHIRLLQERIEALSSPYFRNPSTNMRDQQLGNQDRLDNDLKSRGLCLVPVSYTHHICDDNNGGADYWP